MPARPRPQIQKTRSTIGPYSRQTHPLTLLTQAQALHLTETAAQLLQTASLLSKHKALDPEHYSLDTDEAFTEVLLDQLTYLRNLDIYHYPHGYPNPNLEIKPLKDLQN